MTTIHVSDEVNDRIETIRDTGGHTSKDSALREALNAYDTVAQLDARPDIPWDSGILRAYDELGLHYARPVPDAALPPGSDDHWHRVFVLYLAGPWLQNDRLANTPPALAVLYADGSFLFEYRAESHRYIDAESPDMIAPPGTYHFAVDAADYENELLNILSRSRVHQFLAPAEGVPTDFEAESRRRPTFGGWGRTLTADQAANLFDLPTVDNVQAETPVNHEDWATASDAAVAADEDRADERHLEHLTNPLPEA